MKLLILFDTYKYSPLDKNKHKCVLNRYSYFFGIVMVEVLRSIEKAPD